MGQDGQIGNGGTNVHNKTPQKVEVRVRAHLPILIAFFPWLPSLSVFQGVLGKHKVVQVSCGNGHTSALTSDGYLFIWGRGRDGQIGRADKLESIAGNS